MVCSKVSNKEGFSPLLSLNGEVCSLDTFLKTYTDKNVAQLSYLPFSSLLLPSCPPLPLNGLGMCPLVVEVYKALLMIY